MARSTRTARWYRQPLVWLGSLIVLAFVAGSVWLFRVAMQYPDPPLDTGGGQKFRMPLESSPGTGPGRP